MTVPGDVLDLGSWNLTLPADGAAIIEKPALLTYDNPSFFTVGSLGGGAGSFSEVVFTAPCGGATTKDSRYPRCELRETEPNSDTLAAWSTYEGINVMELAGATLALPPVKAQVVLAQIHGPSSPLLEVMADGIAVEGKVVIALRWKGIESPHYLDADYALGEAYTVKVTAANGRVDVAYQSDTVARTLSSHLHDAGQYFKAGCYTQSNPSKGDLATSFGRTSISSLSVSHSPHPG